MSGVKTANESYLERVPVWPKVDITDKLIDGLVPAARVLRWEDFDNVVDHAMAEADGELVFRGQQHYRWLLKPTLDRFDAPAIDREFAQRHLRNFRLAVRGRVPDNSVLGYHPEQEQREEYELWAVGQHHGLATPLLDWTRSPYIALFFAFERPDPPDWSDAGGNSTNCSRTVFFLNETFIKDLKGDDEKAPKVIEPSLDDHGRLVNQAGLFTIAPYGQTLESSLIDALGESGIDINNPAEVSKYLCKVHIPNSPDVRQNCLRWLRKMNIHHASLFPDLIGASGYCNEITREFVIRTRADTAKKVPEGSAETAKPTPPVELVPTADLIGEDKVQNVVDAFLVTDELRSAPRPHGLNDVARALMEFTRDNGEVDWFIRERELARMRTFVRRRLAKINFSPDHIREAAAAAVAKIAETAKQAFDRANMEH